MTDVVLSARELALLDGAARGVAVGVTARRISTSPSAASNVTSRMYKRLRVRNLTHAVAVAVARGWVVPEDATDLVLVCRPCLRGQHHACGAPGRCRCTINVDTGEDEFVE